MVCCLGALPKQLHMFTVTIAASQTKTTKPNMHRQQKCLGHERTVPETKQRSPTSKREQYQPAAHTSEGQALSLTIFVNATVIEYAFACEKRVMQCC